MIRQDRKIMCSWVGARLFGGRLVRIGTGVMLAMALCAGADAAEGDFWSDVKGDHSYFYSGSSLLKLGGGLVVGGALANSSADEDIQEWYQEDVHSDGTDDAADVVKTFGEGFITAPLALGASLFSMWKDDSRVCGVMGEWGQRTVRGMLVGAPPLLVLQVGTGAARPSDGEDSHWQPFEDGHGVSGHSFMGAVPFLAAAQMSDHWAVQSMWYAASTLCGLSRINDDQHYFSQALLGWWLAWLATDAVDRTEAGDGKWSASLVPMIREDWSGVGVQIRF